VSLLVACVLALTPPDARAQEFWEWEEIWILLTDIQWTIISNDDSVDAQLAALETKLDDISTAAGLAAIEAKLDSSSYGLAALDTAIDAIEAKIDTNDASVDTQLAAISAKVDDISPATGLAAIEAKLDSSSYGLAALDTEIDAIETKIDTNDTSVDTQLATLEGKSDNLQSSLDDFAELELTIKIEAILAQGTVVSKLFSNCEMLNLVRAIVDDAIVANEEPYMARLYWYGGNFIISGEGEGQCEGTPTAALRKRAYLLYAEAYRLAAN